ncbi:MAG: glycosyltransferase [Chitinophagaceae bacterium]|nr:glycosyltransferase [Chitinophagaceae bacterium]
MSKQVSKKNKPTVVAVGLFIPGNSFTRVFASLFEWLSGDYDIHWLGIAYKGPVTKKENYTLHPCNVNGGDIYGAYGAAALAAELHANTLWLLNDFYLLKNYAQAWLPLKQKGIRLLAYVPLDGCITHVSIVQDCFFLDDLVLYNQWALDEVQQAIAQFKQQRPGEEFTVPRLHYRYHGVDRKTFYPSAEKKQEGLLKEKLFKMNDAAESIFILNANRYNERKDIETTIEAFAKALPHFTKPACLCLHTPNLEPYIKEKLLAVIESSGAAKKILLNPLGDEYIDDAQLVNLYRACATGINTSLGEGWGMISFEHAACGAAQIVPGHTAPAEVWDKAAVVINKDKPVTLSTNPFQMYAVSRDELAAQLVKLVNDETFLADVSERCYRHVAGNQFRWDAIAAQWKELLTN